MSNTDGKDAELREMIRALSRQVAKVTGGMGRMTEGMMGPNLPRLLRHVGIRIDGWQQRVGRQRNGKTIEIDLLAVGQWRGGGRGVVVAVECSAHLTEFEVQDVLAKLRQFFDFFAEYRGYDLVAAIAGASVDAGAARHAEKEGFLVIGPGEKTARLLNAARFRPRARRAGQNGR